jgi:hypothetical protein
MSNPFQSKITIAPMMQLLAAKFKMAIIMDMAFFMALLKREI